MTDKSTPAKTSLKTIFHASVQILCDFHIGQAEWRWLHEHADAADRRDLMRAFQKVSYTTKCIPHLK